MQFVQFNTILILMCKNVYTIKIKNNLDFMSFNKTQIAKLEKSGYRFHTGEVEEKIKRNQQLYHNYCLLYQYQDSIIYDTMYEVYNGYSSKQEIMNKAYRRLNIKKENKKIKKTMARISLNIEKYSVPSKESTEYFSYKVTFC